MWQPRPCHPSLPGGRPTAPISSCTSCGVSSTAGKRPSPAAVGAMLLDASRYSPYPCSYKYVPPLGGFSLQVSLCFDSTSIHSHVLLDSGASTCFIDKSFVRAHNIPTVRTSQPYPLKRSTIRFSLRGWLPKPRSHWYFKSGRIRRNSRSTSLQLPDIQLCWGYLGWRHTIQRWIAVTAPSLSQ